MGAQASLPVAAVLKNLVNAWAAQVAIYQQNAVALLGKRESVVYTRKTLTFGWKRTGKQKHLAVRFRAEQRKGSTQVTESFRDRPLRSFLYQAIGDSSIRRSVTFNTFLELGESRFRNSSQNG